MTSAADLIQELRVLADGKTVPDWNVFSIMAEAADTLAANVKELAELAEWKRRAESCERHCVPISTDGKSVFIDGPGDFEIDYDGWHARAETAESALAEIRAENERLDATCTALDKYASEMLGRATAAESENERLTEQRDNLWMAYLHSKLCFHGGVGSTNPDQQAHKDVDKALAGNGPKHGAALNVAKHLGRIPASRSLGLLDGEVGG